MAKKLDPKELATFKELLMANSIQIDAIAQLFIEKGGYMVEGNGYIMEFLEKLDINC